MKIKIVLESNRKIEQDLPTHLEVYIKEIRDYICEINEYQKEKIKHIKIYC